MTARNLLQVFLLSAATLLLPPLVMVVLYLPGGLCLRDGVSLWLPELLRATVLPAVCALPLVWVLFWRKSPGWVVTAFALTLFTTALLGHVWPPEVMARLLKPVALATAVLVLLLAPTRRLPEEVPEPEIAPGSAGPPLWWQILRPILLMLGACLGVALSAVLCGFFCNLFPPFPFMEVANGSVPALPVAWLHLLLAAVPVSGVKILAARCRSRRIRDPWCLPIGELALVVNCLLIGVVWAMVLLRVPLAYLFPLTLVCYANAQIGLVWRLFLVRRTQVLRLWLNVLGWGVFSIGTLSVLLLMILIPVLMLLLGCFPHQ